VSGGCEHGHERSPGGLCLVCALVNDQDAGLIGGPSLRSCARCCMRPREPGRELCAACDERLAGSRWSGGIQERMDQGEETNYGNRQ
jgi:hypothetical protein